MRAWHRDRFPGWWVVAACFVVLTTTSGLGFYGLAVYLNALANEKGWQVASISLATTVFFLVGGVVGLAVARVIARRDARVVVLAGGVLGAAALLLLGQVEERWQLFAVYSLFAVGFAAAGLVPASTIVTRWFHVKRSVALSVASTGLSVGGIVLTPFAKWLLDEQGLEAGTPWLALIWFVGVVPVTILLLQPDPTPLGWLPDGERAVVGEPTPVVTGVAYDVAVHDRFYRAVTIGYLLVLGSQVGGIQQLVKLMEERTDARAATLATTVLAGTSVVARLVGGRVAQRVELMRLTVGLAGVQAVALVAIAVLDAKLGLFAAIVLFGATVGNLLMLQPLLVAERFGVRDYPRIFSRSQFVTMLGTAGGPLLLGWLHDAAGGYRTSYLVAAGCSLAGATVLASGGPARVPRPAPATVAA
jgi:MFS family permease